MVWVFVFGVEYIVILVEIQCWVIKPEWTFKLFEAFQPIMQQAQGYLRIISVQITLNPSVVDPELDERSYQVK